MGWLLDGTEIEIKSKISFKNVHHPWYSSFTSSCSEGKQKHECNIVNAFHSRNGKPRALS